MGSRARLAFYRESVEFLFIDDFSTLPGDGELIHFCPVGDPVVRKFDYHLVHAGDPDGEAPISTPYGAAIIMLINLQFSTGIGDNGSIEALRYPDHAGFAANLHIVKGISHTEPAHLLRHIDDSSPELIKQDGLFLPLSSSTYV